MMVYPLDTNVAKTSALVAHLFAQKILVTGLNYPVVPKGDEEIRLQVSASLTKADIDFLLDMLTPDTQQSYL